MIRREGIGVQEKGKEMGNCNITPIVALRHRQNILLSIDVTPSVRVIDVVVVCTRGGRTGTAESDGRGVDAHCSSTSAMGSTEGSSRGGRREPICQWGRHWMD